MVIASTFGLITALFTAYTGDGSAYHVAQKQPMKLAAMEGLYNGKKGAGCEKETAQDVHQQGQGLDSFDSASLHSSCIFLM